MSEAGSGWKEDADVRLSMAIQAELDENAPFVTDWVLVVTYLDDEGDQATAFNSHPNGRRTSTLGMLNHALEVQKARIYWDERPDD